MAAERQGRSPYKARASPASQTSTAMDAALPYNNYPAQNDYALAILSQAAMRTNSNTNSNTNANTNSAGYNSPTSALPTADHQHSTSSPITNHQQREPSYRDSNLNLSGNSSQSHSNTPGIASTYTHPRLPTTATEMETLVFNPPRASRHNPFLYPSFKGIGSEISRNYANNLGILNAESYADPVSSRRFEPRKERSADEPITLGYTVQMDPAPREEVEEPDSGRRKKRPRTETQSPDDDEESRKKSRGRPRVDTKDETAADRRRTQIRMAQRAYRHRKETTISSLERQVQELRETNEEMSNIFIALHDFANAKGILHREPELAQKLQSATEKYLALAKASSEDANHDEDSEKQDEQESGRSKKKSKKAPSKNSQDPKEPTPGSPAWGGIPPGKAQTAVEDTQVEYQSTIFENRNRPEDLQVITRPTEDNASFPWNFMDLQSYRVEVPSIEDFSQVFLPESQLPLPQTGSMAEFSFARRLHRASLEAAVRTVSNPELFPGRFERVFGFCSNFESKEDILERVTRCLAGSSKDTLQNWRAPFHHVGNAGTHYPVPDGDLSADTAPKFRSAYNIGPFPETISQTQDSFFDDGMRCNFPGWQTEFFDANDVEGYLRSRGLDISPAADIVTAQLDLSSLERAASMRSTSDSPATALSPSTPITPLENILSDAYKPNVNALPFPMGFASWDNDASVVEETNNIDPIFYTISDQDTGGTTPDNFEGDGRSSNRITITFNVQTLLSEILSRGVCLGRSPGFRPSDVNAAIIAAAKSGR